MPTSPDGTDDDGYLSEDSDEIARRMTEGKPLTRKVLEQQQEAHFDIKERDHDLKLAIALDEKAVQALGVCSEESAQQKKSDEAAASSRPRRGPKPTAFFINEAPTATPGELSNAKRKADKQTAKQALGHQAVAVKAQKAADAHAQKAVDAQEIMLLINED